MWPVPVFASELGPIPGSRMAMWRAFPPPLESVLGPDLPPSAARDAPLLPPTGVTRAPSAPNVESAVPPPLSTRPPSGTSGHTAGGPPPRPSATCRYPGCPEPARSTGWCSEYHEERWLDMRRDAEGEL